MNIIGKMFSYKEKPQEEIVVRGCPFLKKPCIKEGCALWVKTRCGLIR